MTRNSSRTITYSVLFPLLCHSQGVVWDGVALVHGLGLHCKCEGATPVLRINNRLQGPEGIGLVGNWKSPGEKKKSFVMFCPRQPNGLLGKKLLSCFDLLWICGADGTREVLGDFLCGWLCCTTSSKGQGNWRMNSRFLGNWVLQEASQILQCDLDIISFSHICSAK